MKLENNRGDYINIIVLGYEFPSTIDDHDLNWLNISFSAKYNNITWKSDYPALSTIDFRKIRKWLISLQSNELSLNDYITLSEPNINFEFIKTGENDLKHIKISLSLEYLPKHLENQILNILFELNNDDIQQLINSLNNILICFPVRGNHFSPFMLRNWYPGSAFASQEWIEFIKSEYDGLWLFSDLHNNWNWNNFSGNYRMCKDTFSMVDTEEHIKCCELIILSRHPGLKDFKSVNEYIIEKIKPKVIVFNPGYPELGNFKQHAVNAPLFEKSGYKLNKYLYLPQIREEFCEYVSVGVVNPKI